MSKYCKTLVRNEGQVWTVGVMYGMFETCWNLNYYVPTLQNVFQMFFAWKVLNIVQTKGIEVHDTIPTEYGFVFIQLAFC